jgi:hypothetical protein
MLTEERYQVRIHTVPNKPRERKSCTDDVPSRPDDVPSRPDDVLKQERFLRENLVVRLSVRTAHVHRPDGAQVYFA